jgi:hypothetical protein
MQKPSFESMRVRECRTFLQNLSACCLYDALGLVSVTSAGEFGSSRYHDSMPSGNDPMQVLAAAVTPVVLVSSTAILISGINARYMAIADKMRALSQEFRSHGLEPVRRSAIAAQMTIFKRRISLVAWSVRSLYAAVACFIAMAMVISATSWRQMLASTTLPLFAVGIFLILSAIIMELVELQLSNRTIALEVRDVTGD